MDICQCHDLELMPDDLIDQLETTLPLANYPQLSVLLGALLLIVVTTLVNAGLLYSLRGALRRRSFARSVVSRAHRPLLAILPLIALMIYWDSLPDAPAWVSPADKLSELLLIFVLTMTGVTAARDLGTSYLRATEPGAEQGDHRARRIHTQAQLLARIVAFLVAVVGIAAALMTFPGVRQIGASMLASAGVAGIVIGFAARPVLSNLLAGVQIALTQPIRLRDSVVVEGEWGWIEEIRATYVVVRIWDRRRLVLPLQWFIDHPFENWTRTSSNLIGVVSLWVDYRMPMQPIRQEVTRLCEACDFWDGDLAILQVVDSTERGVRIRALVTAADGPRAWELRCVVREGLIDFIQREYPDALPRLRAEWGDRETAEEDGPSVLPRDAVASTGRSE